MVKVAVRTSRDNPAMLSFHWEWGTHQGTRSRDGIEITRVSRTPRELVSLGACPLCIGGFGHMEWRVGSWCSDLAMFHSQHGYQ